MTLKASSVASMQIASTASLPGSSTYRFANAELSRNVFMPALLEDGGGQAGSFGG